MHWKAALCTALAAMLLPWCALAQSGQLVTETAVKLQLTGGYVGAETLSQLEQALNDTVHAALIEQLGGDLDYIKRHQRGVVKTLGEVIAPVLSKRGFALEELAIDPGTLTTVSVQLHLAQDLAENFTVQFHLLGSTQVIDEVVGADQDSGGIRLVRDDRPHAIWRYALVHGAGDRDRGASAGAAGRLWRFRASGAGGAGRHNKGQCYFHTAPRGAGAGRLFPFAWPA